MARTVAIKILYTNGTWQDASFRFNVGDLKLETFSEQAMAWFHKPTGHAFLRMCSLGREVDSVHLADPTRAARILGGA